MSLGGAEKSSESIEARSRSAHTRKLNQVLLKNAPGRRVPPLALIEKGGVRPHAYAMLRRRKPGELKLTPIRDGEATPGLQTALPYFRIA